MKSVYYYYLLIFIITNIIRLGWRNIVFVKIKQTIGSGRRANRPPAVNTGWNWGRDAPGCLRYECLLNIKPKPNFTSVDPGVSSSPYVKPNSSFPELAGCLVIAVSSSLTTELKLALLISVKCQTHTRVLQAVMSALHPGSHRHHLRVPLG